jgi:hypothetical protein
MDEPTITPYDVSYSQRVRDEFVQLVTQARAAGLAPTILAAAKEIDRRLHIYPQFGQPLRKLSVEPAEMWIGVVPPLVVHYVLDEERRQVMVVLPFRTLSRAGGNL